MATAFTMAATVLMVAPATAQGSTPAAPTGLTATPGDGRVTLNWTDPSDSDISTWQVQYRSTQSYTPWADVPNSSATTTSHTVTGLSNFTSYTFRVRYVRSGVSSQPSTPAATMPGQTPPAPTGVTAIARDGAADVSWTGPSGNAITGWQYQYQAEGETSSAWVAFTSNGDTRSVRVSGLTNNTPTTIRLRAVNPFGTGAARSVSVTPLGVPATPTGIALEPSFGSAKIYWDPLAATTEFQVRRRKVDGPWEEWFTFSNAAAGEHVLSLPGYLNDVVIDYQFRAVNTSGASDPTAVFTITHALVPLGPRGLSTTPVAPNTVRLSWNEPFSVVTHQYRVGADRSTLGDWIDIPGDSTTTKFHDVTGLTADQSYAFRLRAVDSRGPSFSTSLATVTVLGPPPTPTGLTAVASAGQVALGWDAPAYTTIERWEVGLRESGQTTWSTVNVPSSGPTTTAYVLDSTHVSDANTYDLRVRYRVNRHFNSDWSTVVTSAPAGVPTAPTDLVAAPHSGGKVTLTWTAPATSIVSSYQYRYQSGEGAYGQWTEVTGSDGTTTTAVVGGLTPDTVHTFEVRAVNRTGNGLASASATTTPVAAPVAPTDVRTSVDTTPGSITLHWDYPDTAGVVRWQQRHRQTGTATWSGWALLGADTSRTGQITGLTNETEYQIQVRAWISDAGVGPESTAATAMPRSVNAPVNLTSVTLLSGTSVLLLWNQAQKPGVTGYQYRSAPDGGHYTAWQDVPDSDASDISAVAGNLTTKTGHTFQVRSVDATGPLSSSNARRAFVTGPPEKPVVTRVTGFFGSNLLASWTAPDNEGIQSWQYRVREQGKAWSNPRPADSRTSTSDRYTRFLLRFLPSNEDLDFGTTYEFSVRSYVRANIQSPWSDPVAFTDLWAPQQPSPFTATESGTTIAMSWTPALFRGVNVATYWQYRVQINGADWGEWTTIPGSTADTTSHTLTGLTPGTLYGVQVRGMNSLPDFFTSGGEGIASEAVFIHLGTPTAPTDLTFTWAETSVTVGWTAPTNTTLTGYQYRLRQNQSETPTWQAVPGSDATTTSFALAESAVPDGTEIQLRGLNGPTNGEATEWTSIAGVPAPAMVTGIKALPSYNAVYLEWDATEGATSYEVAISDLQTVSSWVTVDPVVDPVTGKLTAFITAVTAGTEQQVWIRARNRAGVGPQSGPWAATPLDQLAPLTGVTAEIVGQEVHVSWDPVLRHPKEPVPAPPGQPQPTPPSNRWEFGIYLIHISIDGRSYQGVGPGDILKPDGTFGSPRDREIGSVVLPTALAVTSGAGPSTVRIRMRSAYYSYPDELQYLSPWVESAVVNVPAPLALQATAGDGQVELSWPRQEDATISGWQYRIKGGEEPAAWTDIAGSVATSRAHVITGLTNGTAYSFRVRPRHTDFLGRSSTEVTVTPAPPVDQPANVTATAGDQQAVLQWGAPSGSAFDAWDVRIAASGAEPGAWLPLAAAARSHTFTGLVNGTSYRVWVRGVSGGSPGSPAEVTVVPIRSSAVPELPEVADVYLEQHVDGSVTLPPVVAGQGTFTYGLAPLPAGLTFDAVTRTLSGRAAAPGTTTVVYTATSSNSLNAAESLRIVVTAFRDTPTSFPGPTADDVVLFALQDTDPVALPRATGGDGAVTYTIAPALPAGLRLDPDTAEIVGVASEATPQATYTLTAVDADNATDDHGTLTFALEVLEDTAPDFGDTRIDALVFAAGQSATPVTLPAADGGNGTVTYAMSPALPAGLTFDAAARTISGTPTAAAAVATYTYTATDADVTGPDSASLDFTVKVVAAGDTAPAFAPGTGIADLELTDGVAMTTVTLPAASGGDGPPTYAVSPALPAGLAFDAAARTISGTPTAVAAPATFTYTATDADPTDPDSAEISFVIGVAADTSPAFTSPPARRTFLQDWRINPVTIAPATGGNGALTYTATGVPMGLSFDPVTLTLSGTPTSAQPRTAMVVTVTDADGDTATLEWLLTVQASGFRFGVERAPDQTFKVGDTVDVTLPQPTGGDGAVTYALVSGTLPAGLAVAGGYDTATQANRPLKLVGSPTTVTAAAEVTIRAFQESYKNRPVIPPGAVSAAAEAVEPPPPADSSADDLVVKIEVLANPAPSFGTATIADITHHENNPFTTVTLPEATGGDAPLTYTLTPALPAGMTFDATARTISGTPTAWVAETTYTYSATDHAVRQVPDTVSLTFTLEVTEDTAPDFGVSPPTSFTYAVGQEVRLWLSVAHGGNGDLRYHVDPALPEGMYLWSHPLINNGNPQLRGPARWPQPRTTHWVYATDEDGDYDRNRLRLTITLDNWNFGSATGPDAEVFDDQTADITLPAAANGTDALTYRVHPALPAGLTLSGATVNPGDTNAPKITGSPTVATDRTSYRLYARTGNTDRDYVTFHLTTRLRSLPSFGAQTVADQWFYPAATDDNAVVLPEATGGNGTVTYAVSPALPGGVSFDAATRTLSGVPTASFAALTLTYTATDPLGQSSSLTFVLRYGSKPAATNVVAAAGDGQVTLTWDAADDPAVTWLAEYRTVGAAAGTPVAISPTTAAGRVTATIAGLTNGTGYEFRLISRSPGGDGSPSGWVFAQPQGGLAAPTGLTAEAGNGLAVLSWDRSADPRITGWQYRVTPAGATPGAWTDIAGANQSTNRHSVDGLVNGTSYAAEVRSTDGTTPGASATVAVAPSAVPEAPSVTAVSAPGSVTVSWTLPAGSESATDWQWAWGLDDGNGGAAYGPWSSAGSASATSTTVSGLTYGPGVVYRVKVRAVGANGAGPASEGLRAAPQLSGPTITLIEGSDRNSHATIAWDPTDATGVTTWQYQHRSLRPTGGFVVPEPFGYSYQETVWRDLAPGSASSAVRTHFAAGFENQIRIRGVAGTVAAEASPWVSVTPPVTLTAVAGDGTVTLNWTLSVGPVGIWQYRVDDGSGYGAWATLPDSDFRTDSTTVDGLVNDTAHTFQVRFAGGAEVVDGLPVWVFVSPSNEATATPVNAAPAFDGDEILVGFPLGAGTVTTLREAKGGRAPITYSLTPAIGRGLEFFPATRNIDGVPTEVATTIHTLTASDADGDTGTITVRIVTHGVPEGVPGLRATATDDSITLSWDDPLEQLLVYGVNSRQWRRRPVSADPALAPGAWTEWVTVAGATSGSVIIPASQLGGSTINEFQVRGENPLGLGTPSSVTAGLAQYLPATPTGLAAEAGDGSVTLTWTDPVDASIGPWEYRQATGVGAFGPWQTAVANAPATSHTVVGLVNGTTYRFQLRAVNGLGAGAASGVVSATPQAADAVAPAAVTGVTTAAGDTQVVVSWAAPDADDPEVTGYQLRYAAGTAGYGQWTALSGVTEADLSFTVTGLVNGVEHRFQIRAVNSIGEGPASTAATATPTAAAPGAPIGLTATGADARVHLAWTAPSGVSEITRWEIRRRLGTAPWVDWTAIEGSDVNTVTHTVLALLNDTTHGFQIRAVNAVGTGPASPEVTATPQAEAPDALVLSAVAEYAQLELSWPQVTNTDPTGFELRRRKTGDAAWGAWTALSPADATTTSWVLGGLTNGESYDVEVRAVNGVGSGTAGSATGTPFDAAPAFAAGETGARALVYHQGTAITPVVLPEGTGGNFSVTHAVVGALPAGLSFDPQTRTLSGTPTAAAPTVALTYVVSDGDTNTADTDTDSVAVSITVDAADTSPAFAAGVAAQRWVAADPVSLVLPAASGGNGGLTYSLLGTLPDGLSLDLATRTISGTPTARTASAEFVWSVVDADTEDPDWATLRFAGEVGVPRPAAPTGLAALGYGPALVVSWTALGDDTVTGYEYRVRPAGGAFGPWTAVASSSAATSEATVGSLTLGVSHDVEIRAVNASGAGPAGAITGTPVADTAPVFSQGAPEAQLWLVGEPVSLALSGATGGNGVLTYELTPEAPAGLRFDPATRTLAGTPTAAASGTWTLTVADEDPSTGADDADTLSFGVTIEAASVPGFGPDARIEALALIRGVAMRPVTLPAATGGNGDLGYRISPALPSGLSYDEATRELSGTPSTTVASATYTFTVSDSDSATGAVDESSLTFTIEVNDDNAPRFDGTVADIQVAVNTALPKVSLPSATGGNEPYWYGLTPVLPDGLRFDPVGLTIGGTPTVTLDRTPFSLVAIDADGDAALVTFDVSVYGANRAPTVASAIVDQSVDAGSSVSVALEAAGAAVFADADGDSLTYAVSSSDSAVASVSLAASSSTVTVTGVAAGTASVTVTASDGRGGSVSDVFTVTVSAVGVPNQAPTVANAIWNQNLRSNETNRINLEASGRPVFSDADGDALTYTVVSGNPAVVRASLSGTQVNLVGVSIGVADVIVVASDGKGGLAYDVFPVIVANGAPRVSGTIGRQYLMADSFPATAPLRNVALESKSGGVFVDPDGDVLTYAATSADPAIVTVSVDATEATLVLKGVSRGFTTVEVTATDPSGASASTWFVVEVLVNVYESVVVTPVITTTGTPGEIRVQWSHPTGVAPCAVENVLIRVYEHPPNGVVLREIFGANTPGLDPATATSWTISGLPTGASYNVEFWVFLDYIYDSQRVCNRWTKNTGLTMVTL